MSCASGGSEQHLTECVSRFIFHQLHHRLFPGEPTAEDQRTGGTKAVWHVNKRMQMPKMQNFIQFYPNSLLLQILGH